MEDIKEEEKEAVKGDVRVEDIQVMVADPSHEKYVDTILETISEAAKVRGTGIAKRTHEYLATKMREAKAVIALHGDEFAGFSYIETWPLAQSKDFLADKWSGCDADELAAGL